MVKSSDLFCDKLLHGLATSHFDWFNDDSFHFHDIRWCNIVFLHQKLTIYMYMPLLQSKFLAGFLKQETLAFSSLLVC